MILREVDDRDAVVEAGEDEGGVVPVVATPVGPPAERFTWFCCRRRGGARLERRRCRRSRAWRALRDDVHRRPSGEKVRSCGNARLRSDRRCHAARRGRVGEVQVEVVRRRSRRWSGRGSLMRLSTMLPRDRRLPRRVTLEAHVVVRVGVRYVDLAALRVDGHVEERRADVTRRRRSP